MKNLRFTQTKNARLLEKINRIPGWIETKEALVLYNLARSLPQGATAVEIGSYQGKSTIWLGKALKRVKDSKLYSIDHHCGSPEKGESALTVNTWQQLNANIRKFGLSDLVFPIRKKSVEAASNFDSKIALLFIDGDHRPAAVAEDWRLWSKKINDGAWIVLHDATVLSGPWKIAKEKMLFSSYFRNIGMVGSMIYGRFCPTENLFVKIFCRLTNFFKYLFIISYVRIRKISWARSLKSLVLNFFHDFKKR